MCVKWHSKGGGRLFPGTNEIRLSWTPGLDRRALQADTNPVSRVLLRLQGSDAGK